MKTLPDLSGAGAVMLAVPPSPLILRQLPSPPVLALPSPSSAPRRQ